jgi:methionine-rich copper-binding protein CopC
MDSVAGRRYIAGIQPQRTNDIMIVPPWRALPVLAILCGAPLAAQAHAVLVDSQPAAAGHVAAGHVEVRLRYNSRIDATRSRLTLSRPDQSQAVLPARAKGAGDVMTSAADLTPGAYVLRWQVLAIDGHITRGDVPFTVTDH